MRLYEVEINGVPHVMQYSEEVAERLGLTPVDEVEPESKGRKVANKARSPRNKATK